jgi:hypothetical protein
MAQIEETGAACYINKFINKSWDIAKKPLQAWNVQISLLTRETHTINPPLFMPKNESYGNTTC